MELSQALNSARRLTALEAALISKSTNLKLRQLLPDEIFIKTATCFLHEPRDVLHLALTTKKLWRRLELKIYATEVLKTKKLEKLERLLQSSNNLPQELAPLSSLNALIDKPLASFRDASLRLRLFHWLPSHLNGRTALHYAAEKGNIYAAKKAIAVAVEYWPGYLDVKHGSNSPLMLALLCNNNDIVGPLMAAGCFVDAWHDEPEEARKYVKHGCQFAKGLEVRSGYYKKGKLLYTPLCFAIAMRRADLALQLAQHTKDCGLAPSVDGKLSMSPLHLAAFVGMTAVVRTLLVQGYDKTARSPVFCGATPLDMAICGVDNNHSVMSLLLDNSTDIDISTLPWRRALVHHAPHNAIFLLEFFYQQIRPVNLCCEAQYCLEADELLPVLKWIIKNDQSTKLRQYIKDAAQKLINKKIGIPSFTFRYLRSKCIIEQTREKAKIVVDRRDRRDQWVTAGQSIKDPIIKDPIILDF